MNESFVLKCILILMLIDMLLTEMVLEVLKDE
jgi:hypothetical protein